MVRLVIVFSETVIDTHYSDGCGVGFVKVRSRAFARGRYNRDFSSLVLSRSGTRQLLKNPITGSPIENGASIISGFAKTVVNNNSFFVGSARYGRLADAA